MILKRRYVMIKQLEDLKADDTPTLPEQEGQGGGNDSPDGDG